MRRRVAALTLAALLLLARAGRAFASEPLESEAPFETDCASMLLMEMESGQVIFEKNADARRPIASIVKMMTILLAVEAIESGRVAPDETVYISANAAGMGGSQVLLDVGEEQPFSTLVMCAIVASANDAAVALGEHLYGSVAQAVTRMNERAAQLGMENTRFVNCTGLPADGQYSTARDVARMSAELFRHPLYFEYSQIWLDELKHPDGRATMLTNTNRLIRLYEGCDGGKTGSTNEAGYCIAATATRQGMRLIAVVLGSSTGKIRFSTASQILDHGFANYRVYPVAEEGAMIKGSVPVVGGAEDSVRLRLAGGLTLLLRKGEESGLELRAELPESLTAPVREGEIVGSVDVVRDGRVVGTVDVAAASTVDRSGLSDGLRRVLEKWVYR